MATLTGVSTASVLVRAPLHRVREVVLRLGLEAWVAPAGEGWVLVLPQRSTDPADIKDEIDPYDLVGLGRAMCDHGLAQVLVLSVGRGLAISQLMSRDHDTAFIGWMCAGPGEPTASLVEPDAFTFCARFGVPMRTELLELVLEEGSGTVHERIAAFCLALGLPTVAIGATAEQLADERLHLPGVERFGRRGPVGRLRGQ